jgi:PAS domain-containing protein
MTPEGEVEHVNRQVREYFGRNLDELKTWDTAGAVHPDDLSRVVDAWQTAVATGLPYEIEHRMRRRGVPLVSGSGRTTARGRRTYCPVVCLDDKYRRT